MADTSSTPGHDEALKLARALIEWADNGPGSTPGDEIPEMQAIRDNTLKVCRAFVVQSETARRAFEEKPVAWLIERPKGTGKQQTIEREVVLSPLTDDTFMDEGDQAWPLYRQVYTQEGLDAAEARATERHKKLRIE